MIVSMFSGYGLAIEDDLIWILVSVELVYKGALILLGYNCVLQICSYFRCMIRSSTHLEVK